MTTISKIFLTTWLGIQSFFGFNHQPKVEQPQITVGDFNPTGGKTYRLQSSISSTQTSITLASFKEPVSNIPYTMSYLNSDIMFGTIDPQNNTSKEFVSFTGITQNSDGTATLTGVTRGLGFSYPYTASTTLAQSHSGQAIFILSNPPQLYNKYYNLSNVSTSTNTLIFGSTTPPRYDLVPTNQALGTFVSTTSELASVAYVNAVSAAGCATATEGITGCSRLATQLQMASSTFSAGTPTVLYSKYSTSSPYTTGLWIPITRNDGKLSPLFIATTTSDNYIWGGTSRFNGISLFTASTTLTATTTISATNPLSNALILNNIAYAFPSSRGSASTVLTENGSGTLTWSVPSVPKYTYASTSQASIGAGATLNSNLIGVPASTFTSSSTITVDGAVQCVSGGASANNCTIELIDESSNVYASHSLNTTISKTDYINFRIVVLSNNSTSDQSFTISGFKFENNASLAFSSSGTSAINWSGAKSFRLRLVTSAGASNTGTLYPYSIVITP